MSNRLLFKSSMITFGVLFLLALFRPLAVINDTPQQSDILVVLGGVADGRLRTGLEL